MIFATGCSGIGAPEVAWSGLGWESAFASEIEAFPSAVLACRHPKTKNLGDIRNTKNEHGSIDVYCAGTPCQAFSVAGLRRGLDDPRGNLTLELLGILDHLRPRWLVWENVPGVLSIDRGRTFGTFLAGLGQLGYGFAYRVLDAQYFGVAQRRRRVFVVGYLGDWRRAAAVLFERESLCGYPPPSRLSREDASLSLSRCTGSGKYVFGTLMANAGTKLWLGNQEAFSGDYHILEPIAVCTAHTESNGSGWSDSGVAYTLEAASSQSQGVVVGDRVRRLTPLECERLQGFPDYYTMIDGATDALRYKALGNSMAVPVLRWLGRRVELVDSI